MAVEIGRTDGRWEDGRERLETKGLRHIEAFSILFGVRCSVLFLYEVDVGGGWLKGIYSEDDESIKSPPRQVQQQARRRWASWRTSRSGAASRNLQP
jgi:hypothetical protein